MKTVVIRAKSPETFEGSGNRVVEERTVATFKRLRLKGGLDVTLLPGHEGPVVLEADDNILPYLHLDSEGDRLVVWLGTEPDEPDLNFVYDKRPSVRLPIGELVELDTHGSVSVQAAGKLQAEALEVELHGSGRVALEVALGKLRSILHGSAKLDLKGRCREHDARLKGSARLSALDLATETGQVHLTGSGHAQVATAGELDIKVGGSGLVEYRSGGQVHEETSSSGRVVALD